MYDRGKIIPGIVIFLVIFTFPVWYNFAFGVGVSAPDPILPVDEEMCVEASDYMKTQHMDLLNQWRDAVVRDENRMYYSETLGKKIEMSLSNTCMKCHDDKAQFCDECHDYVGVKPYCWECHVSPEK